MTPQHASKRPARRLPAGLLPVLAIVFSGLGGLWLHDHAPGLYVVALLVMLAFVVALIRDQIRRDRAAQARTERNRTDG